MYKYLFAVMIIFVCIVLIQFQGCGMLDRMQKRRWERHQHREELFDHWREERKEHREERHENHRERGFRGLINRFKER